MPWLSDGGLRRTRSLNTMPRIKPILILIVWLLLTGSVLLIVWRWREVRAFWGDDRRSEYKLDTTPRRPYYQIVSPIEARQSMRIVKTPPEYHNICNLNVRFRVMIRIPEEGRLDGLKSLIEKLSATEYHGCRITLQFLLPRDQNSIMAYCDQLDWPHGKVHSRTALEGGKPSSNIFEAWIPEPNEYVIALDKMDADVGDGWFEFVLATLGQYIVDPTCGKTIISTILSRVGGISLDQLSGEPQTLSQQPAKAAILLPEFWKRLQHYAKWRRERPAPVLPYAPPENLLENESWRQYLWEYLILSGNVLIHSNLDVMSAGFKEILHWIGSMAPLYNIPVRSPLNSPTTLIELQSAVVPGVGDGYIGIIPSKKRCILDDNTDPITWKPQRRQYFLYEPHGMLPVQIEALQMSLLFATMLNRTLIVPPFVNAKDTKETVPPHKLFTWNATWASTTPITAFPFEQFNISRHTNWRARKLPYVMMMNLKSPILQPRNVSIGRQVVWPVLGATDEQVMEWYADCKDTILTFRHFNRIIDKFFDPKFQERHEALIESWKFAPPVRTFLDEVDNKWPKITCVIYSRGNGKIPCGMGIKDSKEHGLLYYRSCVAPIGRIAEYALEESHKAGLTPGHIYVLSDAATGDSPTGLVSGKLIHGRNDLEALIKEDGSLVPSGMAGELATLLEKEICSAASLFISNIYSPLGRLLLEERKKHGLPSNYLGQTQ